MEAENLARQSEMQIAQLRKENGELRTEKDSIGDPNIVVELMTLLTAYFMHSISDAGALNCLSWEQKAILKRLEKLIPEYYPDQDIEGFLEIGQMFLNSLTPPSSPEAPVSTLNFGRAEGMKATDDDENETHYTEPGFEEDVGFTYDSPKSKGKQAVRDSDPVRVGGWIPSNRQMAETAPFTTSEPSNVRHEGPGVGNVNGNFTNSGQASWSAGENAIPVSKSMNTQRIQDKDYGGTGQDKGEEGSSGSIVRLKRVADNVVETAEAKRGRPSKSQSP